MQYMRVLNLLWRNNTKLKTLNVLANAVAAMLIFTLFEAILSPSLQGDTASAPGILLMCVACAVCVCKIVADHTYTAQWVQFIRLRIIGASPIKLFVSVLLIQSRLSLIAAICGCIFGLILKSPLNLLYRNLDVCIPAANAWLVFISFVAASAALIISGVLGAGISAYRVISIPPDLGFGLGIEQKPKKQIFTISLVIFAAFLLIFLLLKHSYNGSNLMLGALLCFITAWIQIRTARLFLHFMSGLIAHHCQYRPILLLASRNTQAATSSSLYTLLVIATTLLASVYCLYGYTDTDARTSLTNAISNQKSVIQNSSLSTNKFLHDVKAREQKALVLTSTEAFPKKNGIECTVQKKETEEFSNYDYASVILSGSPQSFFPESYVAQGKLGFKEGVIATASAIDTEGNPVRLGDKICMKTSDSGVKELSVKAVVKFPGALGNYFIPNQKTEGKTNIAFVRTSNIKDFQGDSFEIDTIDDWIRNIPSGKAFSKSGGNGFKEALPIVLPVLVICLFGVISVVFDQLFEIRQESKAARFIGFGKIRFSLVQTTADVFELLVAFLSSMISSVLVVNISLKDEASLLANGIHYFIPVFQLCLLFLFVIIIALFTFFINEIHYQKVSTFE